MNGYYVISEIRHTIINEQKCLIIFKQNGRRQLSKGKELGKRIEENAWLRDCFNDCRQQN